MEFIAD
jgi:hypothetical protein